MRTWPLCSCLLNDKEPPGVEGRMRVINLQGQTNRPSSGLQFQFVLLFIGLWLTQNNNNFATKEMEAVFRKWEQHR